MAIVLKYNGSIFTRYGDNDPDIDTKLIENELKNLNDDLDVHFTTNGGDISEAFTIYNEFVAYKQRTQKTINFYINGVVASAGTYIAMAFDNIYANENSIFMIHSISSYAYGTVIDMQNKIDQMNGFTSIVNAKYVSHTGKSEEEINQIVNEGNGSGSWYFGQEILDHKFATAMTNNEPITNNLNGLSKEEYRNSVISNYSSPRKKILQNDLNSVIIDDNVKSNDLENNNEVPKGNKIMKTVAEFKSEHLDLYNQCINLGIDQERSRVKSHLTWFDKLDNKDIIENINQGKECDQEVLSAYMLGMQTRSSLNEYSQEYQETPPPKPLSEEEILANKDDSANNEYNQENPHHNFLQNQQKNKNNNGGK